MIYTGSVGGQTEGFEIGKIYAWVVYVPSLFIKNTRVTMTLREFEAIVGQDRMLYMMARPILNVAAVMEQTWGDFSIWKIEDNYVSFDVQVQGEEIVLENAYLHAIADMLLVSYPAHRNTMPATALDSQEIVVKMRQICDFDVDAELGLFERLMVEDKTAVEVIPDPLDDEFIEMTTTTKFGHFVHAIGNHLNHVGNSWRMKAEAVDGLQTFVRENLAVNGGSFCFLDAEILAGEELKRLTTHEIWWKKPDAEKFKIPWTKLLKSSPMGGNLGVLPKDRRTLKLLLNELDRRGLYPLPQL